MKFFNKKSPYLQGGLTALVVIVLAILFYFGIDKLGNLLKAVGSFLKILSPFIWGLVIAYLLSPIMDFFEKKVFVPMMEKLYRKRPQMKSSPKLARGMSVIMAVIVLLLVIAALIWLIVPQLYGSIETILSNSPDYITKAYNYFADRFADYPQLEEYATKLFGNITDTVNSWAKNKVLPGMENVVANITTGVVSVLKALYNLIIGIVVAIYILANRENFLAYTKKITFSIFSKERAEKISKAVSYVDDIFMGFLVGNTIDAVIIGVVCYLFCLIFRMPYALLISAIVGITNFIPFFGPFIGGIPSALLILLIEPVKCLIFVIFIIVLQQLDGTYIKPKILGGGLGINGFWVMFSIILFGGLFGFWGMLLGVPVFVIIYNGVAAAVNNSLKKKEMPEDAAFYRATVNEVNKQGKSKEDKIENKKK